MEYRSQPVHRSFYWTFITLIAMHSLAAYNIGGVPIQWLALSGTLVMTFWLVARSPVRLPPGFSILIVFGLASALVSVFSITGEDVSYLMPHRATSTYSNFILLRYLNFSAFLAMTYTAYWFFRRVGSQKIAEDIVRIGVVASFYALYVYVAQLYGLPEIPRSRAGTNGNEQNVVFTYAFHRAMGSFREPSHLAEWLVLPLFMSFTAQRYATFKTAIIVGALLLTGSLTGIAATLVGLAGTSVIHLFRMVQLSKKLFKLALPLVVAGLAFTVLVKGGKDYKGLLGTLWDRVAPMVESSDVSKSNRNYVYEYMDRHPASIFGEGIGNANLIFSEYLNIEVMASFLNLYINILFSLGYFGLILLALVLLFPLWLKFTHNGSGHSKLDADRNMFAWAAYFGWLFIFFAHSEEFSLHFGIIYALLIHSIENRPSAQAT